MDRERIVEIARTCISNHEDPTVAFAASPNYLRELKKKVYGGKDPMPSYYTDPEGEKWKVLCQTYSQDEINTPRDQRHYSYILSRPSSEGINGFLYKRIPVEAVNNA